MVSSRWHH